MAHYKFAKAAAEDFDNIFDYGIDTFGLVKALEYQNNMKHRFDKLAEQPLLYPAVDHIRQGYRRSVFGSHSIYYQVESEYILIVRVLGQQELTKAFEV